LSIWQLNESVGFRISLQARHFTLLVFGSSCVTHFSAVYKTSCVLHHTQHTIHVLVIRRGDKLAIARERLPRFYGIKGGVVGPSDGYIGLNGERSKQEATLTTADVHGRCIANDGKRKIWLYEQRFIP